MLDLPVNRLSFSSKLPMLQLAWDSTSLGELKQCPRKYYYSIVLGYVPRDESVHLTFGQHYHTALETYDRYKAEGLSHISAAQHALQRVMTDTWNGTLARPWLSDDPNKNRLTLARSVVWYLEQFANDPLQTIRLATGAPAVELSFRLDLERPSQTTSEPMLLCGHIDRLVTFNSNIWVVDRKTTKSTISSDFFERYSPDNQFSLYSYAGSIVWSQPVNGIIVDVAQVAITFTRFQRGFVHRTPSELDEWRRDLDWWLALAEHFARTEYWPMNDKACSMYGGCPYRRICSKAPSVREEWLSSAFHRRVWDPLKTREI